MCAISHSRSNEREEPNKLRYRNAQRQAFSPEMHSEMRRSWLDAASSPIGHWARLRCLASGRSGISFYFGQPNRKNSFSLPSVQTSAVRTQMGEFCAQRHALPQQVSVRWDDDSAAGEARLGTSLTAAEPWPRCCWVDLVL